MLIPDPAAPAAPAAVAAASFEIGYWLKQSVQYAKQRKLYGFDDFSKMFLRTNKVDLKPTVRKSETLLIMVICVCVLV